MYTGCGLGIFVFCILLVLEIFDSIQAKNTKNRRTYCKWDEDCYKICKKVNHQPLDALVAICLKGECFCSRHLIYEYFTASSRKNKPVLIKPDDIVSRRHHIAHHCPTIDYARNCIYNCMKYGKPAFCNKDNICYCGHQYEHSVDHEINVTDIYRQYRDMYEKYFGPNIYDLKAKENVDHDENQSNPDE